MTRGLAMRQVEPFAEVEQVQGSIRQVVRELADAVTTIANMQDVPADTQQGLIAREVNQTREKLRQLRRQERLLLDQVAAELESQARADGAPLWAESLRKTQSGDPRRPDRVRDALLTEMVKANVYAAFGEAPPAVLLHRLRLALRVDDQVTASAIGDLALRHVLQTGRPCEAAELDGGTPPPRQHLMLTALGTLYTGYDPELGPLLDALAAFDEARLSPERRRARRLVEASLHLRKPVDLAVWAGSDQLLCAVVERLGDA